MEGDSLGDWVKVEIVVIVQMETESQEVFRERLRS